MCSDAFIAGYVFPSATGNTKKTLVSCMFKSVKVVCNGLIPNIHEK